MYPFVLHAGSVECGVNLSFQLNFQPTTKVKNPEPKNKLSIDWIIWAAWADRITFEEIREKTGTTEHEVIKIMRKNLKASSFRLWRKRVNKISIKSRKKFEQSRRFLKDKSWKRIY